MGGAAPAAPPSTMLCGAVRLSRKRVRFPMVQRAEQAEAEDIRPDVETTEGSADDRAELRPERLEVAHLAQVPTDHRAASAHFVGYQFVMRPSGRQRGSGVLGHKDR